jgi:hypothetical protein
MQKRKSIKARRAKARNQLSVRHKSGRSKKTSRASDPFFSNKEVFYDSGPGDVAENHDKYLYPD